MDVTPGIYAFSNPSTVHYVGGRAYCATMEVTAAHANDDYVGRLVEAGIMSYAGPAAASEPDAAANIQQLLSASAQPVSVPVSQPAPVDAAESQPSGRSGKSGKASDRA